MDIILLLTIRSLRQNRKRTAVTLVGITTASIFLTLSVIFIYSFMKKISTLDAVQADIKKIGSPYKNPTVMKDSGNREKEGFYMNLTLTGLDDESFEQYLRQVGISENHNTDAAIPVIVEDTVLLKNGNSSEYQEFLNIGAGELFSVIADRGRGVLEDTTDIDAADAEENGIEFIQYQFQAIAVTPPIPSCYNIDDGLEETNEVHLYTTQYYFENPGDYLQTPLKQRVLKDLE